MIIANQTDVGKKREHNEDGILSCNFQLGAGDRKIAYHLSVVSDGMGGAAAGEVASAITLQTVASEVYRAVLHEHVEDEHNHVNMRAVMERGILKANTRVFYTARASHMYAGMGATCTACLICQGRAYIGQVGDSRCYLFRRNRYRQVTQDHSFVQELLREGRITKEEAEKHPRRNVITRAIGSREKVAVDVYEEPVYASDTLLLCSDGLSGMVDDRMQRAIFLAAVGQHNSPSKYEKLCSSFVDSANLAGGTDNISVILIHVEPRDIPKVRCDHIIIEDRTLTWHEASVLELDDLSYEKEEVKSTF